MPVTVELNTPLAEALNAVVQPKLVEVGWSTGGGDDSALAEYVILMLVNGKTQDQIAAELSNDLLSLGPDDTEAVDFSRWLFEQVETLNRQLNGGGEAATQPGQQDSAQAIPTMSGETQKDGMDADATNKPDTDMGDAGSLGDNNVPTGPKTMRNQKQNGQGRLLGQLSRSMDRSNDSVLHRVRNQQGSGRINTHNRDPPRGPRGFQTRNGRGQPGRPMGMSPGMGMGNNPMQNAPPGAANMMQMTPQQQMQMMAMFEEQARVMSQFMPGFVPPAINPAFQNNSMQGQQGRSLFERAEHQPHSQRNAPFQKRGPQNNNSGSQAPPQEVKMDVEMETEQNASAAQESQQAGEPSETVCRYNLRCTNKDCPYGHQSPAAPEGTSVDMSDACAFGAACKNRKCVGRHPSPAQKSVHQSEELCRFFPNCANPHCHFKHPDMPLCRNGADCSVAGCKFTHIQTPCKFNPCLNRVCPYKHAEGQRGGFTDKVWKAPGADKPHVSERKFTEEADGEEELIKPGGGGGGGGGEENPAANETNIIT